MEVSCQIHAPAALLPGKKPPLLILWKAGLPQSASERYGEEKNLAPAGKRTPALQPVAIPTELSRLHTL
jgi:hypothetical protein